MATRKKSTSDALQYAYNRYIGDQPEQVAAYEDPQTLKEDLSLSGSSGSMDITPSEIVQPGNGVGAVEYEGFRRRKTGGSHHIYQHPDGRQVFLVYYSLLVYHNLNETFGPKAIRQVLRSTGWSEDDLRRRGLLP